MLQKGHRLMSSAIDMRKKIKILFLAANPDDRTPLELGRELSRIRDALLISKYRDHFKLVKPDLAARMVNFTSALIKHQPHIVHFCGHGSAHQGIVFESDDRYSRPADKQELAALFAALNQNARLIFLNACHTQDQAELLGRTFDYTIGTDGLILDRVAGNFAGCFYRSLGDGATVGGAFLAAQAAVDNQVSKISVLSKREEADDSKPFVFQVLTRHQKPNPKPDPTLTQTTVVKDQATVRDIINIGGNYKA